MPDEKPTDETGIECSECGDLYEDDAHNRKIRNKLSGRFLCPSCMAEQIAGQKPEPKPPAPATPPKPK